MTDNDERKRVESAQALKKLMDDIVLMQESFIALAKMTRAKYSALVAEGFTEAQAIELCKSA